mgnify:FL=1
MFTLTIKSRDYIPFTLRGSAQDLQTAVMVMASGFSNSQTFEVTVSGTYRAASISGVSKASELLDVVHDLIVATTPRKEDVS